MSEHKLSKVQVVESERFTVQIWGDDSGKLGIEIGSKDGSGVSKVELETNGATIKQKFSTDFLENEIDKEVKE